MQLRNEHFTVSWGAAVIELRLCWLVTGPQAGSHAAYARLLPWQTVHKSAALVGCTCQLGLLGLGCSGFTAAHITVALDWWLGRPQSKSPRVSWACAPFLCALICAADVSAGKEELQKAEIARMELETRLDTLKAELEAAKKELAAVSAACAKLALRSGVYLSTVALVVASVQGAVQFRCLPICCKAGKRLPLCTEGQHLHQSAALIAGVDSGCLSHSALHGSLLADTRPDGVMVSWACVKLGSFMPIARSRCSVPLSALDCLKVQQGACSCSLLKHEVALPCRKAPAALPCRKRAPCTAAAAAAAAAAQAQERTAKLESRVTELTEYSQKLEGRVSELESEVAMQAGNAARIAEEAEERIREV
eukprot:1158295-Pelagomonas_calceolata.AAC.1